MRDSRSTRSAAPARRPWWLAALALALVPLIAACEFTVSGTVTPTPSFRVTSASLQTNYQATLDGVTSDVICNDRQTELVYSFRYEGELSSWRSYLRGVNSGEIAGDVTLTPGDPRVEEFTSRSVRVRYILMPNSAPTLVDGDATLAAEAPTASTPHIVVVPTLEGYTRLFLSVQGYSLFQFPTSLASDEIPVLSSCD